SQGSGSGLDIAASTFGGMFIYKSFTQDWMSRRLKKLTSVTEMVKEPWKFFYYERVQALFDVYLSIGWTGKSASTKHLVEKVRQNVKYSDQQENIDFYLDFLKLSGKAVEMFVHGIRNAKKEMINKSIDLNRNLLKELSKRAGI